MKKFLIIFGVILLLILGAVWAYVFIYGVPENAEEIFARFDRAGDAPIFTGDENNGDIDIEEGSGGTNEGLSARLRQLTTRPVAGATYTPQGIRYVERGTGHVYEIELTSGEERIISGTTLQRTIRARFSPDGSHIALTSEQETGLETVLGTLIPSSDNGSIDVTALPPGAREVGFGKNGETINFFVPTSNGGTGYEYTLATKKTVELFSIPLRDVRVLWGTPTYIYTTPSAYAMGYVYRVGKTGLEYVTEGGKGLMAFSHASGTLVSKILGGGISTVDLKNGPIPQLILFPEKCTSGREQKSRMVYCASPRSLGTAVNSYPDDWYKGTLQLSDALLEIDTASSSVRNISNLEKEAGRPIDIADIGVSAQGDLLYFINKYDGALWMLDLKRTTSQ